MENVDASTELDLTFNWVYLVELLVCSLLAVFFLFYFNRLFAAIISYAIRTYTWHKYQVFIDIKAIQISLLGGRLFFKGFRYHGNNETILVHSGHITWRYWLRNVRDIDIETSPRRENENGSAGSGQDGAEENGDRYERVNKEELAGLKSTKDLPCRISISARGFEWFIYNRSAAYDYIAAALEDARGPPGDTKESESSADDFFSNIYRVFSKSSHMKNPFATQATKLSARPDPEKPDHQPPPSKGVGANDPLFARSNKPENLEVQEARESKITTNSYLRLLPIHIDCQKGAVVMGNHSTRCVLTAKFEKASGEIDASSPSLPNDQYKQLFNFQFIRTVVEMRANADYKESQLQEAQKIKKASKGSMELFSEKSNRLFQSWHWNMAWNRICNLIPPFRSSVESISGSALTNEGTSNVGPNKIKESEPWIGLSRYLIDDAQNEHARWESVDYAKSPTVADCPTVNILFFWDVGGLVPHSLDNNAIGGHQINDINSEVAPEWGLNLQVHGGHITYGPWTDRQRSDLQSVFFPRLFQDSTPAKPLKAGDSRVSTLFRLFLELTDEVIFRIPTREDSKDWKWKELATPLPDPSLGEKAQNKGKRKLAKGKGKESARNSPESRPFGWIDIKVASNSSISYSMTLYADVNGFKNQLDLDVRQTEISTSVNHGILSKSEAHRITCDLSNPPKWNGPHSWIFNISSSSMELFLLRDHIFLFTDLITDWVSGPPSDYYTFTPFQYVLILGFDNFNLHLNVNDSNIINNPSDFEDNTFISVFGDRLDTEVSIPLAKFRPLENEVTFKATGSSGGLNLLVPPWNTQATFLKSKRVASLQELLITGSYNYFTSTSTSLTDTLFLHIQGLKLSVDLYGFLIRYFLKIKDNYFGDEIHFKTLEEFQKTLQHKADSDEVTPVRSMHFSKRNDLDVILSVEAKDARIHLPANVYCSDSNVQLELPELCLDVRVTNYYMDLDLCLGPLTASLTSSNSESSTPASLSSTSGSQAFVNGIKIFGHRLFGLPPSEPTYMCNWDFSVGTLTGEISVNFFKALVSAVRALAFSFDDNENALSIQNTTISVHDVTFLRARVQSVRIWLHIEQAAFMLSTDTITFVFNDWARSYHSDSFYLSIPNLSIACVDAESASRHRTRRQQPVNTHAYFNSSVVIKSFSRITGFSKNRQLQQEHIRKHDSRTDRTSFLLLNELLDPEPTTESESAQLDFPAMPVPRVPEPVRVLSYKTKKADLAYPSTESTENYLTFSALSHKVSLLSIRSKSNLSDTSIIRSKSAQLHADLEYPRQIRSRSKISKSTSRSASQLNYISNSTGFRTSMHGITNIDSKPKEQPQSNLPSASPFITPYFPMGTVAPDLKDLPIFPKVEDELENEETSEKCVPMENLSPISLEESSAHSSLFINFRPGVRAFCKPQALFAMARLADAIHPKEPHDILDDIQISSISSIFSRIKQKGKTSDTANIRVDIPHTLIRIINTFGSTYNTELETTNDQFDICLLNLTFCSRTRLKLHPAASGHISAADKLFLVHVALKSASISANEYTTKLSDRNLAFRAEAEDVVFSTSISDTASLDLKVIRIGVTSMTKKVECLLSMGYRLIGLWQILRDEYLNLSREQQRRFQDFAFALSSDGVDMADPTFITRPSYLLRSDPDHLRLSDSWKIVSRFRYIYMNMPKARQMEISSQSLHNSALCPHDAQRRVLESFDQWRNWELEHAAQSHAMEFLYGPYNDFEISESLAIQTTIAFSGHHLALVLDLGPKQNEFTLDSFIFNTSINKPLGIPEDSGGATTNNLHTTVQLQCAQVIVSLNWELCDIIDDVTKSFQKRPLRPSHMAVTPDPPAAARRRNQNIHIILGTDAGTINLDCVNIKVISTAKSLTASLLYTSVRDNIQKLACGLLTADATSSEISCNSKIFSYLSLQHPSIYIALDEQSHKENPSNSWKLVGNCQNLSFEIREDMIGLMEAIDSFISDEVAYVHRQLKRHFYSHAEGTKSPKLVATKPPQKFHLALFLESYKLSMDLVRSLTYAVSGQVARISLVPRNASEVVIDFDLKTQSHDIWTGIDKPYQIAIVELPPVNGHVVSQIIGKKQLFEASVSIEKIRMDAAAVHSLLHAINKPEISETIEDIRTEVRNIKLRLEEIFGATEVSKSSIPTKSETLLVYNAHLTVVGFAVHTSAPSALPEARSAYVEFDLGSIQLKSFNRLQPNGPTLEYPEIQVSLQRIAFELAISGTTGSTKHQQCGNLSFGAYVNCTSAKDEAGDTVRAYNVKANALEIYIFAETASTMVDVICHLQERIKDLDLYKEVKYLRKFSKPKPKIAIIDADTVQPWATRPSRPLFSSMYSLEVLNIQISWIVGNSDLRSPNRETEDLVISFKRIDLSTRKKNAARLIIEEFLVQMVPTSQPKKIRSLNSALMPEIVFNVAYVSTKEDRRLAFQAAGKSLDLQLTTHFVLPASDLQKSIASALAKLRSAAASWDAMPNRAKGASKSLLGNKRIASLSVDIDFAGAVVFVQGKPVSGSEDTILSEIHGSRADPQHGRYGQFSDEDEGSNTTLRAPGVALKVEYMDNGQETRSLNAEIKVDASTNVLYPAVVPLVMEISSSVKEIVSETDDSDISENKPTTKFLNEDMLLTKDPSTILGGTQLNVGLQICRQEFSLSCQPYARVAATARFEDIYFTVNTLKTSEQGHFFSISGVFTRLQASVKHVYSRESTASFDVDSIVLSFMNSKHVSGKSGISAMLKVSPMKALVNAKQLQDFLLFREIWVPAEIRKSSQGRPTTYSAEPNAYLVQRYQQVAAAGAFPWNATVSIADIDIQLDLGQALGKSSFIISEFWVSSKKTSDWEQNLHLGFQKISIESSGRMSGFIQLQHFKLRTSIQWPSKEKALHETPLVQASLGFGQFRVKAAFDYQAFLIADITSFDFLMYNIHDAEANNADRLVAILDGDKVQMFCTTTSACQALSLYQAFVRLIQEKKTAYEAALKELERFLKRKTAIEALESPAQPLNGVKLDKEFERLPITLHTDVVVNLKSVNLGAFPSSFFGNQIFKLEILGGEARFAVGMENGKIHCGLSMTLGELRIALASVDRPNVPKTLAEVSVEDVISAAANSRSFTILKVPRLVATMQTWQILDSNHIDYLFKSLFEGKVDVGWNYSRISFIRGMWASHSYALAQRLGKPLLYQSTLKITGVPQAEFLEPGEEPTTPFGGEQEKITAVVNVPQSKYEYTALEPPIIETPQLRDMGEATPPLEWIGLNRDRLPNLTHQIVIVSLLEVARKVEDAYTKILGSS
ncbi:MAG: hypothetical protein M1829_002205 [Trizodia sp. TS-e1964]|nr:MAG: hypothetical protein M1829_002205 [Trizodia sp. TS-e1964]